MAKNLHGHLLNIIRRQETQLLEEWLAKQRAAATLRVDLMKDADLAEQSRRFLSLFSRALGQGEDSDILAAGWTEVRDLLGEVSRMRARQGFSPSETATFIFSLKEPLFACLRQD